MRPELYTNGLKDLINYINQFQSTSEMTMVEIGSYAGEGTEIFAEHFKFLSLSCSLFYPFDRGKNI